MWDNLYRYCVVCVLYEYLFWEGENLLDKFDMDGVLEQITTLAPTLDYSQIQKDFDYFKTNHYIYQKDLIKYLTSWDKTFTIVKAVLMAFCLELELQDEIAREKITTKYIRLTQELVGGQNPSLVHAVVSKVLDAKGYPHTMEEKVESEDEAQDDKNID